MVTDAHWQDGSVLNVIDFKTGKYYDTHIDQAQLYGLGGLILFPSADRVTARFMYLDDGGSGDDTYTRKDEAALKKDFNKRVAKLAAETKWKPQPNKFCRWCPFAARVGGPCKEGKG